MGKVKINKDDKARILLTELLPYEVPMLFSNEGFYSIVTNKEYSSFFDKIIDLSNASNNDNLYGIPFNYEIGKSGGSSTRTLSVMHPYNQYQFIELYEKYDSLMLHLCSKSPFSLRKISKVAKFYYAPDFLFNEDPHKGADVETENDVDPEPELISFETRYIKSYFTYKPVDLIYKFYERHEYQRLEQRFRFKMEFDISKCFYNIYTHSVCWAVKNKETSKRNARKISFENSFDKIMQLANYNETNGILVGPEVSRIFAEIILQQIDLNVLKRIEKEYKLGVDFEIRRYVDDYFVFSNQDSVLYEVKRLYKEELEYYKLYLNDSKEDVVESPFVTDITVGKREIKRLLNDLFKDLIIDFDEQENDKLRRLDKIRKPYSFSQNFIRDFQCVVKKNNLSYSLLSKDVIRSFKSKLVKILKDDKLTIEKEAFESFLMVMFDISFYSYSLNINSNTTFKIAQIIVLVCKELEKWGNDLRHKILSKILKDADFVLTNHQRRVKVVDTKIETLNLLLALKKLGKNYSFSQKRLIELFGADPNNLDFTHLNYFEIVSLLYYIGDNDNYLVIRKNIEATIVSRFDLEDFPFAKAEFTLLFFDIIKCPIVSSSTKRKIVRSTSYCKTTDSNDIVDEQIKRISSKTKWFMDWDEDIDLERVLKKKEWGSSY